MIDIVGKRKIYLGFSLMLVAASLVLIIIFGLREGIDLRGGSQWQLAFLEPISEEILRSALVEITGSSNVSVKAADDAMIIRMPPINEEEHQKYLEELRQKFGYIAEDSFSSIGPTIGSELRRRALWAITLVLVGISAYIAFAFRKTSREIKSWKYGLITLLTLFHDVSIPAGLLALLGRWQGIEMDTNFIVALLVVMGFSVHDTIVVFDRIRENLIVNRDRKITLGEIINYSVNETMARSINTSLTLVLVLLALIFLGPTSLLYFILTILVGTVVGTYSSIFVASPLLYLWASKELKK